MRYVHVRTEQFAADALALAELPAKKVFAALNQPRETQRAAAMFELLSTAIAGSDRRRDFEALSYGDAIAAVNAWITAPWVDMPAVDESEIPS